MGLGFAVQCAVGAVDGVTDSGVLLVGGAYTAVLTYLNNSLGEVAASVNALVAAIGLGAVVVLHTHVVGNGQGSRVLVVLAVSDGLGIVVVEVVVGGAVCIRGDLAAVDDDVSAVAAYVVIGTLMAAANAGAVPTACCRDGAVVDGDGAMEVSARACADARTAAAARSGDGAAVDGDIAAAIDVTANHHGQDILV